MQKPSSIWTGRLDSAAPERLHQLVREFTREEKTQKKSIPCLTFLGFCSDVGVRRNQGRPGAQRGPEALRRHLANMCVPADFSGSLYDAGDISCSDDALEAGQESLAARVQEILAQRHIPVVLGGGHETAWGMFQGIFPLRGKKRLGILNFDAHFDLRPLPEDGRGNSGTPFTQIAQYCEKNGAPFDYTCIGVQRHATTARLFARAKEHNVAFVTADELHLQGLTEAHRMISNMLDRCDMIYLTLCLDVFAAAYAPGVSAPSALGLSPWQVIPLLRKVLASGKVCALDVVELSPPLDEGDKTAKLGAALIMEMITSLRQS
jgi:formiminoglutamase